MEITAKELKALLKKTKPALDDKCIIPILTNFHLDNADGALVVEANDYQTGIKSKSKHVSNIKAVVPPLLLDLVELFDDNEKLTIAKENSKIVVRSSFGEYHIATINDDFPEVVEMMEESEHTSVKIKVSDFIEAISRTVNQVNKNTVHPTAAGIGIKTTDAGLAFCSTNTFVIIRYILPVEEITGSGETILPVQVARKFKIALSELNNDEIVTLKFNKKQILVESETLICSGVTVAESIKYPFSTIENLVRTTEADPTSIFTIKKAEFAKTVTLAGQYKETKANARVKDGKLNLNIPDKMNVSFDLSEYANSEEYLMFIKEMTMALNQIESEYIRVNKHDKILSIHESGQINPNLSILVTTGAVKKTEV